MTFRSGSLPYFPSVSFYAKAVQLGHIYLVPNLLHHRQLFVNRLVIPGSHGLVRLTIPIIGGRNVKNRLDQVRIDHRTPWARDHFRSLVSVYGNSPFFNFYSDELRDIYETKEEQLLIWNLKCLEWSLKKLRLNNKIAITNIQQGELQTVEDMLLTLAIENQHIKYPQVFEERTGFMYGVSILDMIFNMGPSSGDLLSSFNKPIS